MQLYDNDENGDDYSSSEDMTFISELLLDMIEDLEETRGMLKTFLEKSGQEGKADTVMDYLNYALGSLTNAEHDLTDVNFELNSGELKDYRWEPSGDTNG